MGVDESGQNGAPARVDDGGIAGNRIPRDRFRSDGDDSVVPDRNGFRMGIRGVSTPDSAVDE